MSNTTKFSYTARWGTIFRCDVSDFSKEIRVINAPTDPAQFAGAVAEMIAHHAMEVYPKLNGFAGYDTLRFRLV